MSSELSQPPAAVGPQDFSPARAVVWMMGSFFLMMFLAVLYLLAKPEGAKDMVALGIVSTASFVLISAYLLGRYPGGPDVLSALGVRRSMPGSFFFGLALGVTAKVPAEQVRAWVDLFFPLSREEHEAFEALFRAESSMHAASMLFVVALMVPIAEEVFFRGAVYGALRRSRVNEVTAVVVTALGFTLCHADLRQMPALLLVAFLLGVLRSRSGSLVPAIGAHMGFNGGAIVGVTYGLLPELDKLSVPERIFVTALHLAILGAFLFVTSRDRRAEQSRKEEQVVLAWDEGEGDERGR